MSYSIEICITALSSNGEGIGTLDGLKVFVEGALPGERVLATITESKKTYAKADLLSVLSPSSERTKPLCPVFGQCGGCQIMHLNYAAQLEVKGQKVVDALTRIGGFQNPHVHPCLPSPNPLGYRNKIQLPIHWEKGSKKLGLYKKKSHEIIPIKKCFIQCPQGEQILKTIDEKLSCPSVCYVLIRCALFCEEDLVIFITNGKESDTLKQFSKELMDAHPRVKGVVANKSPHGNTILGPNFHLLAGRPYIFDTLLNCRFKISPGAFFQVNPAQAEKLYEKAIELADIQSDETVVDAYCGVGALAILAATQAKKVFGIECVAEAIRDAKENMRLNKVSNCTFLCAKSEKMIHQLEHFDTVFLNPPRKGCDAEMIHALIKIKPKKIIYISCDPATLARDLAQLLPHYSLSTVQPFDMFPQTTHVETIVCLNIR